MNNYIVNESRRPTLITSYPNAINTNNTQYSEGTINPVDKKTITKVVNIDSIFRHNYRKTSSTNFNWDLIKSEANVVSMRVSSVDIPISWYAISDINGRNQFCVNLHNMNDGSGNSVSDELNVVVSIPPGNYTSELFAATLNKLFHSQGRGLQFLIAFVDSVTLKTIIRAIDKTDSTATLTHVAFDSANIYYSPDFYFELDFFPHRDKYIQIIDVKLLYEYQRTIGWFMGFQKYNYIIKKDNIVQHILFNANHQSLFYDCGLSSESQYNNSQMNYIFIVIDDFHSNCVSQSIVSSTGDNYISNNILARITVNNTSSSVVYDNGSDKIFKERAYMGPVTLEKLKISVINRYGELIDLNGRDFSLTLELTELY